MAAVNGDDVARKLASIWPDSAQRERARAELCRYGTEIHERDVERVRLAILKLCDGQFERLTEMVAAAKQDYRDVLMWAEYPAEGQALWALGPKLSAEQRQRLEELRAQDRAQYRRWLTESGAADLSRTRFRDPDELWRHSMDVVSVLRTAGLDEAADLLERGTRFSTSSGWEWLGELGQSAKQVLQRYQTSREVRDALETIIRRARSKEPYES